MRWSELQIQTLRDEPAEGPLRLRLLARAGYLRMRGPEYLFLARRAMEKIATAVGGELDADSGTMRLSFQGDCTSTRAAIERGLASVGIRVIADDPVSAAGPEDFATPGVKSIADLAAFMKVSETSLIKSVVMSSGGSLVLVLVRGDHALDEKKLHAVLGAEVRAAEVEEIRAMFGAEPGSLGPLRLRNVRVMADEALHGRRNMTCGANRNEFHTRHVTPGHDFKAEFHDLRVTGAAGTPVLAEDFTQLGWTKEAASGCEGLLDLGAMLAGVPRDEKGLVMHPAMAPFSVVFTPVNLKDEAQRSTAEALYEQAKAAGCDAVLDDRDERPGVKFKDSELVGIPWRVTLGKGLVDGKAEIYERSSGQKWDVPIGEAVEFVRSRWDLIA